MTTPAEKRHRRKRFTQYATVAVVTLIATVMMIGAANVA